MDPWLLCEARTLQHHVLSVWATAREQRKIFKSTRNVSRKFQIIYSSTWDRWYISEGDHQGEDPIECEYNKIWEETDRVTHTHSQVPNATSRNGHHNPYNDGDIQRGSGGTES